MQQCPVKSKALSASNATALTRQKTITNLGGAAKQTRKKTLLTLRQKKTNYVCIYSRAPIVVEITRQTSTCICSGSIGSIANGTSRNIMRSMKTGPNQSI